jgi:hypothetical protein
MRLLLAITILAVGVGGALAQSPSAATDDAAHKRALAKMKRQHQAPPRDQREAIECERAQHEDPTGQYATFPCWAREAFSKGNTGGPQ